MELKESCTVYICLYSEPLIERRMRTFGMQNIYSLQFSVSYNNQQAKTVLLLCLTMWTLTFKGIYSSWRPWLVSKVLESNCPPLVISSSSLIMPKITSLTSRASWNERGHSNVPSTYLFTVLRMWWFNYNAGNPALWRYNPPKNLLGA